jgi:hypothetical protein
MNTDTQLAASAQVEAAAALLLSLGFTADATRNNLTVASEVRTESVEGMILDGAVQELEAPTRPLEFVDDDTIELQGTVTEAQLVAAAASSHSTFVLKDMILAADASQESLTRLLCARASVLQIDNPIAAHVGEAMRAVADHGECYALDFFVTQKQLPSGALDSLCYLLSKNGLTSLIVAWQDGQLADYRQLWAAIRWCRGLWHLHYNDNGFVYDRDPTILQQTLAMKGIAASVETLTLSLTGSKTRGDHAELKRVLRHLRRFRELQELSIVMHSQMSLNDMEAIKQFAIDRPRKLRKLSVDNGEQQRMLFLYSATAP